MLDDEARERLDPALAARRLVDFSGPHGWEYSATNLGRTDDARLGPVRGRDRRSSGGCCRWSRCGRTSSSSRAELRDADRGADDADLEPLDKAAHQIAVAENKAVFHGWHGAMTGIAEASPHAPISLGDVAGRLSAPGGGAVERLLHNGISGPYGLALGGEQYRRVVETAEHGGYPLLEHLRKILEGPIVWAPGCRRRGRGQPARRRLRVRVGQDLSIGYDWHDADVVRLYLEESFSFHVATPEAAVMLSRVITVSRDERPDALGHGEHRGRARPHPAVAATGAADVRGSLR